MKYADIDMNISTQALLVLRALSVHEIPDAWGVKSVETSAWYNGRERGVCVTFQAQNKKALAVTFGECRNSDSIFIDHFEVTLSINPPTVLQFSDSAYRLRRYAPYLDISKAVDVIIEIVEKWAGGVA